MTAVDVATAAKQKYEDDEPTDSVEDVVVAVKPRKALNKVTEVVLSGAGISTIGADFATVIASVRVLDLSGNGISSWGDVGALVSGLKQLVSLDLSRNTLSSGSLDAQSTSLSTIKLSQTGITWDTATEIIQKLPTVTDIALAGNDLPDVPAELPVSETLQTVWLGDNKIQSWGSIASTFGMWPNLAGLFVMGNPIETIVVEAPTFPSLASLSVSSCPLDGWGSVEALANLPALRDLRMYDISFMSIYTEEARRALIIARLKNLSAGEHTAAEVKPGEVGWRMQMTENAGKLNRGPITLNELEDADRFMAAFVEPTPEEAEANKAFYEKTGAKEAYGSATLTRF